MISAKNAAHFPIASASWARPSLRSGVLVGIVAALAFPATAFAHANLDSTSPTYRQRLQAPVREVVLRFDQTVQAEPNAIEVRSEFGKILSGAARARGPTVRVPLKRLPRGAYTVRWHVLSEDGHVVSGVFTFGVGVKAPPPTEAYGASGPTTTEHVVRWAYFLSLALLLGGLGFRLLLGREELPAAAERRFFLVAGAGVVGTLEVGILAFMLRAEDALQLPFGRLLYGDLSSIAGGTRFGEAFIAMTLGYALVAAFVFLAWLSDRRFLLWPALVLGLGFASGLSLSGHSAVDAGSSWRSELADWAHLSAAALWIGGLVQLAFVVWPKAPELRRTAFLRFSRLASGLIAVVLGAGLYLSIVRLPQLSDLWTAGYGRVLLVKLGLVSLALTWGAVHHFVARSLRAVNSGGGGPILARLPRSLAGESAVGMAILLAAAVLVDSKPPSRAPASPVASSVSLKPGLDGRPGKAGPASRSAPPVAARPAR
jgi:copper transport protein